LRKNIEKNSQKKLKKKPLVEKDIVENCCELRNIIKLLEMMMNLKLKIKLGKLLRICPRLKLIKEKYLLKIKEPQMIDVCKVTTIKIKNFNEAMLVVQVRIRKFGV
jgi:hypothetical protein